jgi:hypothetical protein
MRFYEFQGKLMTSQWPDFDNDIVPVIEGCELATTNDYGENLRVYGKLRDKLLKNQSTSVVSTLKTGDFDTGIPYLFSKIGIESTTTNSNESFVTNPKWWCIHDKNRRDMHPSNPFWEDVSDKLFIIRGNYQKEKEYVDMKRSYEEDARIANDLRLQKSNRLNLAHSRNDAMQTFGDLVESFLDFLLCRS